MVDKQTVAIPAPAGFLLKASALSHGWHECAPMSWSEGGRCLQIIGRDRDQALRIAVVEGKRRGRRTTLNVTLSGRTLNDSLVERMIEDVRLMLGLDRDVAEFHALCRKHPALRQVPSVGGGRGLRSADMTENIIKALCATNVTWSQAVKMINRLAQLGPTVRHFVNLNAWPTPREILRAGENYLVEVCRVGYRAESILRFCRNVCERRFDPGELDRLAAEPGVSSDELLKILRSIHGIGPSSAHYLLGFLGRHDRLSIDSATVAHVARTHTGGRRPSLKEIERIYEPYGKWRNLVYWYESWMSWDTAREIVREINGTC